MTVGMPAPPRVRWRPLRPVRRELLSGPGAAAVSGACRQREREGRGERRRGGYRGQAEPLPALPGLPVTGHRSLLGGWPRGAPGSEPREQAGGGLGLGVAQRLSVGAEIRFDCCQRSREHLIRHGPAGRLLRAPARRTPSTCPRRRDLVPVMAAGIICPVRHGTFPL